METKTQSGMPLTAGLQESHILPAANGSWGQKQQEVCWKMGLNMHEDSPTYQRANSQEPAVA